MRRVLRPGGKLLFVEHGLAPDEGVRRWQDRLTPAWRCISEGCHLNRPIRSMIEGSGFRIDRIETGYIPGPKPMTFMYEGSARPNRRDGCGTLSAGILCVATRHRSRGPG
jgi:hypothetical protein